MSEKVVLQEGEKAPDFTSKDQNGNQVSLSDYKGKKVILYFYPRDNTPGCTKEACNFNENLDDIRSKGLEVIGVSPDSEASHINFIEKYGLKFTLLTDPDKEILLKYGAFGEKNSYGKISIGVIRSTFIIDEQGNIEKIIKRVKTAEATEQVYKLLDL